VNPGVFYVFCVLSDSLLMQDVLLPVGMETRFCRCAYSFFLLCYEILILSMKINVQTRIGAICSRVLLSVWVCLLILIFFFFTVGGSPLFTGKEVTSGIS
jgi:hypothetical protein